MNEFSYIKSEVRRRKFLVFFNNINTYYFIPELNVIYDNFTNFFFRFLAIKKVWKLLPTRQIIFLSKYNF